MREERKREAIDNTKEEGVGLQHAAQISTMLKELALFVKKEYKEGEDSGCIFRELKDVQVVLPLRPKKDEDKFDLVI